jgi:lipoic acid synthetase
MDRALGILTEAPPDVLNHNLETVPRLYRKARPGGDYAHSLKLLHEFKKLHPAAPTKSGLMVGLGENDEEILQVMCDLRAHGVDMLTIGQYLQPSPHHLPVERYVQPEIFNGFQRHAAALGFRHAAIGPMVRSSYHADQQAQEAGVSPSKAVIADLEQ